ncbi:MAG: BMP family ABC transporter substrate-binding protein, partial [Anaerolineales bacterium]
MQKKIYAALTLLVLASLALAACGPAATPTEEPTAPPETAAPPTEEPTEPKPFRVGFVTDTGGIDDNSFNETQWNGILRAQEELGIQAQFIQSDEATQYTPNLTEFASQGYDLVIAAGFFLAGDVAAVAAQ